MDNKELLKAMKQMLKEELKPINDRLDSLDKELKEFREETNKNFVDLKDQFSDLEGNNGARHLDLTKEIKQLKSDFTVVEAVTGKNMTDIAQLKSSMIN